MAPRYVLLAVGAFLVLATSVYLFVEVRGRPAEARAPERAPAGAAKGAAAKETAAAANEGARETAANEGARKTAREAIDAEEDLRPAPARAAPPRTPAPGVVREPPRGPDGTPEDPAPHKLEAVMNEANKAYDRGDLDEARAIARRVLGTQPGNVRMLRIVVSASCIAGDSAEAQAAFVQLPKPDREQMKTRCARYGVSFAEP